MSESTSSPRYGLIGLGDMGGSMACALLDAGLQLVVTDLRRDRVERVVQRGALGRTSAAEVVQEADVVGVVVLDDSQMLAVVEEIKPVLRAGKVIVLHSTVQPATVRRVADDLGAQGVDLVDAPVSGGAEKGRLGTLTVMVGGTEPAVAQCMPYLEAIGNEVRHVGPVGAGATVKVVNNLLSIGTYALMLEAMQIAAAYGVDEDTVLSVVTSSQGDSRVARTWPRMDRIRRERHGKARDPKAYDVLGKDLVTAVKVAGSAGLVVPMATVAAATLTAKMMRRDHELDTLGDLPEIPRCVTCHQELAPPYRAVGRHPECR